MVSNQTTCIKRVGGKEICDVCNGLLIRYGKSSANKTRYRCKNCGKTIVESYTYEAYHSDINQDIITYIKEGLGIRSTARILKIFTSTLLSRIISIAKNIIQPPIPKRQSFSGRRNETLY
ncbi:MAG: IS1-like element transposase [Flavobacterium sp.]|nr:IS1-like element transposase [Flavobacterium sp.]